MIGELRAEAFFARVNRVSVLDFTGAEGNILPGDEVDGTSLASATDKWLVGGNIELLPMQKNIFVGVTPMLIFDNESTNSYTYRHVNRDPVGFVPGDKANPYEMQQINPYDDALQNTFVLSARVGADVAALMQNKNLTLDLVAEYAMSMNKTKTLSKVVQGPAAIDPTTGEELTDPETGETVYTQLTLPTTEESANGSAILANLNVGYKVDNSWSAGLALDFIRNDEKWFNNLAQSPSFFAQRILNSDKDGETVKYGVNSPLYSTFDALYNYSPKFSPMTRSLGTNDDKIRDGQSKSYNIAPYNKNSWGSNVYTAEQLALLNLMMDPALQLALPNGLATANRMGVRALIKGDWQGMVEAQALVSIFNQVKPEIEGLDKVSYMEFGGGAKVDIAKIAGLSKALEVSGSYKHSESKNNMMYGGVVGTLKSDFINAGLCAQFLPRLGFTAGFQMINSDYGVGNVETKVGADVPLMKSKQMQWMVGFDYTVADNAWLAINYGMINVTNDYNTATVTGTPRNLPDYFSNTKKGKADGVTGTYQHKFSQSIFEASINVEF